MAQVVTAKRSTISRKRQKKLNAREKSGHVQKKHRAKYWFDLSMVEWVRRHGSKPSHDQVKMGLRG